MTTVSCEVHIGYVDVDIDLGDISTADLTKELASRKTTSAPPLTDGGEHPLHEIYYALKFNMDERANDLMRKFVCDELGVVL